VAQILGFNRSTIQTCSMLMVKVLFDRENSKENNLRRQGYQDDIRCPTGESSRTIFWFVWFVNVCVLFYTDDMELFLPVRDFQDCMKIQLDLNKLSDWCERYSLFLNVDKCKIITFSRTQYPVEV
jgi:hypothetical protein